MTPCEECEEPVGRGEQCRDCDDEYGVVVHDTCCETFTEWDDFLSAPDSPDWCP